MAEKGHAKEHHGDPKEHERHYIRIWVWLTILLVASVAGPLLADRIFDDPESLGRFVMVLVTAFGIALVKAYMVGKHFMHITLEPKFVGYIVATSLVFMGLFFFFVAPDVMKHAGTNWDNVNAQAVTAVDQIEDPHERSAAEVYQGACVPCHGVSGHGNGPAAGALRTPIPDFHDPEFWSGRERGQIVTVIRDGGARWVGGSPHRVGFGAVYTEAQIEGIADMILAWRPAAAPEAPPTPPAPTPVPPAPSPPVADQGTPATPPVSEAEARSRAEFIRSRIIERLRSP